MSHIFSSERPAQRRAKPSGGQRIAGRSNLDSLQNTADGSPAQRKLNDLQQMAAQRMEDEELMQGKAKAGGLETTVQRMEEEELMQGKAKTGGMEAPVQRMEEEEMLQGKAAAGGLNADPVQRQEAGGTSGNSGLPGGLRAGIESLSGVDMSDVQVHYNSSKPAQLNAHAYAQGTDIHLASGQEQHLGHEAWHVVQQKQGRVRPTTELSGVGINDDVGLEAEADRMGAQALQTKPDTER